MPLIDFATAEAGTPEANIFVAVTTALQFTAFDSFVEAAITNIVANVADLTDTQKLAIRAAAALFPGNGSTDNLNNLLRFVLYGDFAAVGLVEAVGAPLSSAQREGILEQIYTTATDAIAAVATALAEVAETVYVLPDYTVGA